MINGFRLKTSERSKTKIYVLCVYCENTFLAAGNTRCDQNRGDESRTCCGRSALHHTCWTSAATSQKLCSGGWRCCTRRHRNQGCQGSQTSVILCGFLSLRSRLSLRAAVCDLWRCGLVLRRKSSSLSWQDFFQLLAADTINQII